MLKENFLFLIFTMKKIWKFWQMDCNESKADEAFIIIFSKKIWGILEDAPWLFILLPDRVNDISTSGILDWVMFGVYEDAYKHSHGVADHKNAIELKRKGKKAKEGFFPFRY